MNTKPTNYLDQQQLPKQRDLLAGKKYRDTIKKWGEPTNLLRKRVMIVPSIACEARDVYVETSDSRRIDGSLGKSGLASVSNSKGYLSGKICCQKNFCRLQYFFH
jgi:hypothetical protein